MKNQEMETIAVTIRFCELDSYETRGRVFRVRRPASDPITDFIDEAYELLDAFIRNSLGWSDYETLEMEAV